VLAAATEETCVGATKDVTGDDVVAPSTDEAATGAGEELMTGATEVETATEVEDVMTTGLDEATTTGEEVGTATGLELTDTTTEVDEATIVLPLGEAGAGELPSSALTHPVFCVSSAGQDTCSKSTVGLSLPPNQSKRQ